MSIFKKKKAPSTPSAESSFLDQVETLGKGYEKLLPIFKEWEPKFLEHQLETESEFAPEFAGLDRRIQEMVNPEGFSALSQLSEALGERGDLTSLNISPEIQHALQQDVRSGQYARGMALSPVSALSEAQATLPVRIAERDKWLNLASGLAGRAQITGTPQAATAGFGAMGTPQITAMTSLQQQANEMAFARWDREQKERARRYQAIGGAFGGDLTTVGSMFNASGMGSQPSKGGDLLRHLLMG